MDQILYYKNDGTLVKTEEAPKFKTHDGAVSYVALTARTLGLTSKNGYVVGRRNGCVLGRISVPVTKTTKDFFQQF